MSSFLTNNQGFTANSALFGADDPNQIYYEVLVSNKNTSSTAPLPLTYLETRNSPYLNNPSEYNLTIVRFTLDTPSLPVFIPTMDLTNSGNINPNSSAPQPTIYSITLTYTDPTSGTLYSGGQTYINWIPEIQQASITPNNTTTVQDNSTPYYYCYSYQWWIMLCNEAFQNAYNSLQDVVATAGLQLPSNYAPFFVWDSVNGIATMNADVGSLAGGYLTLSSLYGYTVPTATLSNVGLNSATYGQISICFNSAMYQLFNSFPSIAYGYGSSINFNGTEVLGGNVQIPVFTYAGQNSVSEPLNPFHTAPETPVYFAQIAQEYSTVPMWNPIMGIVFTSSTIPVQPMNVGTPFVYNGDTLIQTGNNSNISAIVTDFQSSNNDYRGFINYTPTGQYRLIDLFGNKPLTQLNFTVFWKSRTGQLFPFYLVSGASAQVVFGFFKKAL